MNDHQSPIFITGRFRSGTTLFWNFFDRLPGYAAFYEPLHDNLVAHIQYTDPMPSHVGVNTYWNEYRPVFDGVKERHRPEFGYRSLVLEPDDTYPELKEYLDFLIKSAYPRRPVLQFNRVDFRLPWLLKEFSDARIIHVTRNSRDTWLSSRRHLPLDRWADPYEPDAYDLLMWAVALEKDFPFLMNPEPVNSYELFYSLWLLSNSMGKYLSHVSIDYDHNLITDPQHGLDLLVQAGCLYRDEVRKAAETVSVPDPLPGTEYFDDEFFSAIEDHCETCLASSGLTAWFGKKTLQQIRAEYPNFWNHYPEIGRPTPAMAMLNAFSLQRAENIRLLWEVRKQT